MSAFGTVVIGKRETLSRPGTLGPGEGALQWPDQGTAERNWALNDALLDRIVAAGCPIRDADGEGGIARSNRGFLARERARIRDAGMTLGAGGHWRNPPPRSLMDVAFALLARARAAAERGATSFAVPEAVPVAAWIASRSARPRLQARAVRWLLRGAAYHELVRLCADAARALDGPGVRPVFRAKVAGELEAMLALWPHVLVLPTPVPVTASQLVGLRALPVHPLGLVAEPTWADGEFLAPSEFFFHDLDHARFKVREDCLHRGLAVPDAYREGTTVDPRSGRHRMILPAVARHLRGARPQPLGAARPTPPRDLLARVCALPSPSAVRAAKLLLFEIVHEKGLPLDPSVLTSAVATDTHVAKLWRKQASGFFGVHAPGADVMNALPAAVAAIRGG